MRQLSLLVVATLLPIPLYASSFAYEDIASFPRYRVVLTENRVPESEIFNKEDIQGDALSMQRQQFVLDYPSKHDDKSVIMMNGYGQPFQCTIPDTTESEARREAATSDTTFTEQDTQRSIERGLKLLEPLGKQGCLYFPTTGYWTYEYCHMRHVRQFHFDAKDQRQGAGAIAQSQGPTFYLGYFAGAPPPSSSSSAAAAGKQQQQQTDLTHNSNKEPAVPSTSLHSVGDQRYLTQRWTGGTMCDLTGKPRSIEIQFHCDLQADDQISMFQEVATCQYQMVITTPRLCEEMMLTSQSQSDVNTIVCNPIVPDHLISAPPSEEQEEQEEQEAADVSAQEQAMHLPVEYPAAATAFTLPSLKQKHHAELSKDPLAELQVQLEELNQLLNPEEAGTEDYTYEEEELGVFRIDEEGVLLPENGMDIQQLIGAYMKMMASTKDDSSAREDGEDKEKNKRKTTHRLN